MNQPKDYAISQKVIHWLMAILILLDLVVAQKFGNPMVAADRIESRGDHASLGTIVAVLFIIRLGLRFKHGAPALPSGMTRWQIAAAKWGHVLLYVLIGLLILSGISTAINAANPILLFGKWDITIGQQTETLFDQIRWVHEFVTNAIIALIVVHIFAALYHWLIIKDDSFSRMLKFWVRD